MCSTSFLLGRGNIYLEMVGGGREGGGKGRGGNCTSRKRERVTTQLEERNSIAFNSPLRKV